MIFLNTLYCTISQLVILKLTMPPSLLLWSMAVEFVLIFQTEKPWFFLSLQTSNVSGKTRQQQERSSGIISASIDNLLHPPNLAGLKAHFHPVRVMR